MSLASIRTLYDHHWWANRTLLDTAAKLGEVTATRTSVGSSESRRSGNCSSTSTGSTGSGSHAGRGSPTSIPGDPATLTELRERWILLEREQGTFLEGLREPDLERVIDYRLLSGKAYRQPRGLLLHHVTDHGTHHRSEIATMLTMVSGQG